MIRELRASEINDILSGLHWVASNVTNPTTVNALRGELKFGRLILVSHPDAANPQVRIPDRWYDEKHDLMAQQTGWALFERSDSRIAIQRIDDDSTFDNDDEAYHFVRGLAVMGNETAQFALELDELHGD